MKDSTIKLLVSAALIVAVISFAQSAYLLMRPSPVASAAGVAASDTSSLQADVRRLQIQVAAMTNALASIGKQKPLFAANKPAAGQDVDGTGVALLDDAVSRLEQIVDSVGLEQLATNERMDPDVMRQMYSEYAARKEIQDTMTRNRDLSAKLMEADRAKYGDEIQKTYDAAHQRGGRGGRGNRGGNNDNAPDDAARAAADAAREQAFNDMVAKYPDASMTGMLIAERAMGAMFRGDTASMEKYYQQLSGNQNFANLPTGFGVEAVPSIQYMLASRYIDEGRNADAEAVISSLERDYGQSMIFAMGGGGRGGRGGGRGGPPNMQTGSSVAAQLRQRLNAPRN